MVYIIQGILGFHTKPSDLFLCTRVLLVKNLEPVLVCSKRVKSEYTGKSSRAGILEDDLLIHHQMITHNTDIHISLDGRTTLHGS